MANLIKIGHTFLNIDCVLAVEDRFPIDKEDKIVVRFYDNQTLEFSSREADDLRTWLNSKAVNLQSSSSDLDMRG